MVETVSPVREHFGDEHVVGVDPPIRPNTGTFWRRRIRPFTGRALSHTALEAEQVSQGGMQRLRGQSVSHGTIDGLAVAAARGAIGASLEDARVLVGEGLGLTRSGEDVALPADRSLRLASLPTIARVDLGDEEEGSAGRSEPMLSLGSGAGLRPERPRRMYRSLGQLVKSGKGEDLPRVLVLVAEPVTMVELVNPGDPECPPDRRDEAFDDLQYVDGARLALYAWPSEMTGIGGGFGYALPPLGPQRRNLLANRIFAVESGFGPGDAHPWEAHGVPLAMIGFADDWSLDFVDAAAVARLGGQPLPRSYTARTAGDPYLWQARMAQFAGQVVEQEAVEAARFAEPFALLPPVGLLPGDLFDPVTRHQSFFPAGFDIRMAPIAAEQVIHAVREAAPLAPIDLTQPDMIEALLPVPAHLYDADLLRLAAPDPAFQNAIDRFTDDRSDWLRRRGEVRASLNALCLAHSGSYADFGEEEARSGEQASGADVPAPHSAVRILTLDASNGFELAAAGPKVPLDLGEGGQLTLWVRLSAEKPPKALAVRIADGEDGKTGVQAQVWGDRQALGEMKHLPDDARVDALPKPGAWTKLVIEAGSEKAKAPGGVAHLVLGQAGGIAEWGPIASVDASGRHRMLFAGYWPEGARYEAPDKASYSDPREREEESFGEKPKGDFQTVPEVAAFKARWQQPFLAEHRNQLDRIGFSGLVEALDKRLQSTNDAIDLGFVRARSDIYRLREYILGKDAAAKLVTSPALADLSSRDESARATGEDLAKFLQKSHTTLVSDTGYGKYAEQIRTVIARATDGRSARDAAPAPTPTPTPAPIEMASMLAFKPPQIAGVTNSMVTLAAPPPPPPPPPASAGRFFVEDRATRFVGAGLGSAFIKPIEPEPQEVWRAPTVAKPAAPAKPPPKTPTYRIAKDVNYDLKPTYASVRAGIFARGVTKRDVQLDRPLPGLVERTVSVARRIDDPPSKKAYEYAIAGKMAIMNTIAGLVGDMEGQDRARGIALGDLPAPGFVFTGDPAKAKADGRTPNTIGDVLFDQKATGGKPGTTEYRDAADLSADESNRHESDYFNAAVAALDNAIALMRFVEGRIDFYTNFRADASRMADTLAKRIESAETRLAAIGIELAEARHDVEVATALLAEAQQDAAETNARRAKIIAEFGHTILYRRVRSPVLRRRMPMAATSDALAPDPVISCRRSHTDQPEELREYVGLFQDAPLAWFPAVARQVDALDKRPVATTFLTAVLARLTLARRVQAPAIAARTRPMIAVRSAMALHVARVAKRSARVERFDFAQLSRLGLSEIQRKAKDFASLADVMEAGRERPRLARAASAMMRGIEEVSACLHAGFDDVAPAVRMRWAELLSQHDDPVDLVRLSALPDWGAIPIEQRRRLQDLTDWLFAQIDTSESDAVEAMSELVRVALLLASHAPVDQLIPATLAAPAPAEPGQRIPLSVDVSAVRTGLLGVIRNAQGVRVAQAEIADIGPDIAEARIVRSFIPGATLEKGFRVDFTSLGRR